MIESPCIKIEIIKLKKAKNMSKVKELKNMNSIYLRRKSKVVVDAGSSSVSMELLATLLKNLEALGYILSDDLLHIIASLSETDLEKFYKETISDLKVMVGDHVEHKPMYPNFPKQVMKASDAELYFNAIMHYFGDWLGIRIMPEYKKKKRKPLKDEIKLKEIGLGTREDFKSIFTNLVASNTSLSNTDKEDVEWFVRVLRDSVSSILPDSVPLRENIAFVAGLFLKYGIDPESFLKKNVKTATDVLRLAVKLSDGDVSLAKVSKFRNFSRKERRMLLGVLNGCKNITEDMLRYREPWKRLGERLHPFENKDRYPNCSKSFSVLFNKEPFQTFRGKVEQSIVDFNISEAVSLLKKRPGEYARRIDNMIRLADDPKGVVDNFEEIASEVSTPVLLQVKAHFENRPESGRNKVRTFFPKGNIAKLKAVDNTLQRINPAHCKKIVSICEKALRERFSKQEKLGKVYIDDRIRGFYVPFSQRSASKALRTVPRGSRYSFSSDKKVVRFFIHWKNTDGGSDYYHGGRVDIDLSAIGLNEDHKQVMQVSYTNLREQGCYHSGDITSAPDGASEFIDVDIEKCKAMGVRYMMMSVFSFTQQPFCEIPECFAGIMMREKPKSGEIFDPRTVDNRIDLTANNQICIPLIIDLQDRQVIWTDLGLKRHMDTYNNLHANMSSLQLTAKAMTSLNKPKLYDLFKLHAEARGEIVNKRDEADTIFGLEEGITPFDADIIVADYIK